MQQNNLRAHFCQHGNFQIVRSNQHDSQQDGGCTAYLHDRWTLPLRVPK